MNDIVDTPDAMASLMDIVAEIPKFSSWRKFDYLQSSLYFDVEGVNLSRQGSVSILQIFVLPKDWTFLIDIHVLKESAFSTPSASGVTLKNVLEDCCVPKAFFDVRMDSAALHSHFQIELEGVWDIQLMECAARIGRKRYLNGLAKCIEYDAPMTPAEKEE